ncbi:hypothetical protein B7P43_G15191 [Cryptotermes secundus]|uniref:DUF7041 domain-containing protein n=1 Tax=Cryptotermes secundus TaxID=105785 RepID=A0A2J7QRD7_9NEOP|nr:hypothetical protein B7P43_G15191 [Cryptotermes secundus]
MDAADNSAAEVSRVAVRLPPFWPEGPALWFAHTEVQFTLAGIIIERIKFCLVISQLDYRYTKEVENIITFPLKRFPYTLLRTELVRRLSQLPEQRIRQLLTVEEFGDSKPSQFLRYLMSLTPDVSVTSSEASEPAGFPGMYTASSPARTRTTWRPKSSMRTASPRSKSSRRSIALVKPRTTAHFRRRSLTSPAKWLHSALDRTASTPASRSLTPNREKESPVQRIPAPPSTATGLAADPSPVTTPHPVPAGTIAASALGRKTVFLPAPTASRETDAADIFGVTFLCYDDRPSLHNGQSQQTAVPGRHGFGPLCVPPQARPSTHEMYQL